jgi:tetratricopeptide (TPR) repeat protein
MNNEPVRSVAVRRFFKKPPTGPLQALLMLAAFTASASAAATGAGSGSVEDVHQNILELLRADAASMTIDPAPVHVQIPKIQEAPHGATTNKTPAPVPQPVAVAVKPVASTQGGGDPELEKLRHSKVYNPAVAADAFFKAGRRTEAAILYEQALQDSKAPDKDWALLQLGACKEQTDPQAALALYGRLLAECPNSSWRRLATSRQGVLQWLIAQDVPNLLKNPAGGKTK